MISTDIVERAFAGLVLSIVIAAIARSRKTLSASGAIAAVMIATSTSAAGWTWAATLIAFFVSSTVLSEAGRRRGQASTADVIAKGGQRDAWQVIANGGPFAATALASLFSPSMEWTVFGAGAIAASNADTWATEIGTLSRRFPRSITTCREVIPGTSGGVTLLGIAASIAGAAFVALFVLVSGWTWTSACGALIGGTSGSLVDSILGATVQEKRWCHSCGRGTERAVHTCGIETTHAGGVSWIRNDAVNFLSSIAGALTGYLCHL